MVHPSPQGGLYSQSFNQTTRLVDVSPDLFDERRHGRERLNRPNVLDEVDAHFLTVDVAVEVQKV